MTNSFDMRSSFSLMACCCALQMACGSSEPRSVGEETFGTSSSPLATTPAFPLKLSANHRYLVDQNNTAFLINQASSWGLVQALSNTDAAGYLDGLRQRGFNTVMASIISNDARMAGNPPNWQGVPPFTTQWDYSTYNLAYFAHVDEVIKMAKDRGMLVTLVPSYLGYPSDPSQGWADEMMSSNNSVAKSLAYGRFLGARYRSFPNVIWIAGGDNQPAAGSELENRLKAIMDGIKEQAPDQLWTGHWDSVAHGDGVFSSENSGLASYMDIDGYYAYNWDLTHQRDLQFYNRVPVKMIYHLDQSYEGEFGGTTDNIRRKAYSAVLMGAAGSSFCAGSDWWQFYNWRNMSTPGTLETQYWYQLFASRAWYELVPDQNHQTITSGYGDWGDSNYVTAARTSSGSTVIAYAPWQHTMTVNLARVSGTQAKAWWYDPTNGQASLIGTFATTGSRDFTNPTNSSWVLVIDDAALNLPVPGAGVAPPSPSPSPSPSNAPPTVATAAAAGSNPVAGSSTSLSVLGADDGGEANLRYTWATAGTPPASVTFSPNGSNAAKSSVATFGKAGLYTLQATIADAAGQSVTSAVNVNVSSTLTDVVASPASASIGPGASQQFTAVARDQFGFDTAPQPSFSWAVNGGGSISSGGLFTAGSAAGGPFNVTATTAGKVGNASVTVVSAAVTSVFRVNAGGAAVSPFDSDRYNSGGFTFSGGGAVSTAGVANAAPASVYQTERYGNFSYSFTGMAAASSHRVRLHFAEIYWQAAGSRLFDVSINGSRVLSNFDVFVAAGGARIAVVRDFNVTADAAGNIVVSFTTIRDNAKLSAIEIL
jgi:hypothetical protein